MGLKVHAAEAARLVGRSERTVREWIATGRLSAQPAGLREKREGVGPGRWLIDVDDLAAIPGVQFDAARLAELMARDALLRSGHDVLGRLEQLERQVATLEAEVADLKHDRPTSGKEPTATQ